MGSSNGRPVAGGLLWKGYFPREVFVSRGLLYGSVLLCALVIVATSASTQVGVGLAKQVSPGAAALASPMRIAEGPPGQVLVSDSRTDAIVGLDQSTRTPLWSFGVDGTPMGVGFAADLVLVGNASKHVVQVFRMKGARTAPELEWLYDLGFPSPEGPGNIQTPSDMEVDKDARLAFVLDSGEHRVKVFSLSGDALYDFPQPDSPTRLLSPTAIAIDPVRQEVLVSDYGDPNGYFRATVAARIMVFTYSGDFVTMIDGGTVTSDFQFARPQGLAVDSHGRVFVAESLRGEVFGFDRTTGEPVKKIGSFGNGPGELMLPMDLFIERRSGDMLVTNNMLGRIEFFRAAGGSQ